MKSLIILVLLMAVVSTMAAPQSNKQKETLPRLLRLPNTTMCMNRPKQWKYRGHHYFFSWDFAELQKKEGGRNPTGKKVDWLEARNSCRDYCMDSISMETEGEARMVQAFMGRRNKKSPTPYLWTSGRICDFTGCKEREDLKPLKVKGWFWSATNSKADDTDKIPRGWRFQPWSQTGHTGTPQPDNAEFGINNTPESCLAVLNDIYRDGIVWHDIACYHKKPYICEDSDVLLEWGRAEAKRNFA